MNTATTTLNPSNVSTNMASDTKTTTIMLSEGYFAKRSAFDWVFAVLVMLGAGYALSRYSASMDFYDKSILVGLVPAVIW